MAFRLFQPTLFHLRTPLFAAGLGFSGALLIHQTFQSRRLLRLDTAATSLSPKDWSFSQYQNDARTPITKGDGTLNPNAIRQLSLGSILGMHGWAQKPAEKDRANVPQALSADWAYHSSPSRSRSSSACSSLACRQQNTTGSAWYHTAGCSATSRTLTYGVLCKTTWPSRSASARCSR